VRGKCPIAQSGHFLDPIDDLIGKLFTDFGQNHVNGIGSNINDRKPFHTIQLLQEWNRVYSLLLTTPVRQ
jgi:hypothetical protein